MSVNARKAKHNTRKWLQPDTHLHDWYDYNGKKAVEIHFPKMPFFFGFVSSLSEVEPPSNMSSTLVVQTAESFDPYKSAPQGKDTRSYPISRYEQGQPDKRLNNLFYSPFVVLHRLATSSLSLPCWWPGPTVTSGWSRMAPWSKGLKGFQWALQWTCWGFNVVTT